jgi:hypothetical protein
MFCLFSSCFSGVIPQYNRDYIWQTHRQYHRQCWNTESFSSKARNKSKVAILTILSIYNWKWWQNNQAREGNKRDTTRKGRNQILVWRLYDSILRKHWSPPKNSYNWWIQQCRINIKKLASLYANNELTTKESEKNPIDNSFKRHPKLGVNMTKTVKDHYHKNFKEQTKW